MYIWLKKAIKSLALAGLVVLACSPVAKAESQRTYRIATVAWMGWSPLHVACENGYWTRQGIKVQVVDYDDPTVILEAMKAGMIDFAMDMVGSLVGVYLKGVPLVVLAETDWSHGGDKILVRSDTDLHALVGQPVGVFLNLPSSLFFLDQYLKEQKLRLDQFRIVEIRAQDLAAQFAAGRIKAMVLYEPWAALAQSQTRARLWPPRPTTPAASRRGSGLPGQGAGYPGRGYRKDPQRLGGCRHLGQRSGQLESICGDTEQTDLCRTPAV